MMDPRDREDRFAIGGQAECSKGWAARCSAARGKKCRCACGGKNHNGGRLWAEQTAQGSLALTESRTFEPRYDPLTLEPIWATRVHGSAPRSGVFTFQRRGSGIAEVFDPEGRPVMHRWVRHSPTGFEWGYGGSGPADLALNLLAYYLPAPDAWRLHIDAKADFVARIPMAGGTIQAADLLAWVEARLPKPVTP